MKKNVKKRIVVRPLSAQQKRRIAVLAAKADSKINYSDIPPLAADFWRRAVRNPFYRQVKRQLTVRLDADADIVAWLRSEGRGYQTRLNGLLRAAMLQDVAGGRS